MTKFKLTTKAKIALLFSGASLIAGSSTLIHNIINAETIEDAIKLKNFSLLDDDKQWEEILKDYTEQIKTQKDLKIGYFEGGVGKVEEFKKQCEWILKIKYRVADSQDFVNAVLWCVKQQTVEDYLVKNNYSILKIENRNFQSDNPKWDKKIKEYLSSSKENEFFNSVIKDSTKENIIEGERTAFIKGCEKLNKTKHFDKEFEKSYKLGVLWCAEKLNSSD